MYLTPLSRKDLLTLLPRQGTVAEVGVNNGAFAKQILRFNAPAKLHLIDPWGGADDEYVKTYKVTEDMNEKFLSVSAMFARQIGSGSVVMHRGYSVPESARFPDGYFDWVYIDAMHTYEAVRQDLDAFDPKVRADGLLVGHDFSNNRISRAAKFGVMKAVTEFALSRSYSLLFVTLEAAPSYVVAKAPNGRLAREFTDAVINANPRLVELDGDMISHLDHVRYRLSNERRTYITRLSAAPNNRVVASNSKGVQIEEFLITRFNMLMPGFRKAAKLHTEEEFNEWCKQRVPIFLDFCLPSVLSQTRRPSAWIIGFDAGRRHLIEPILEAIAPHEWIKPVFHESECEALLPHPKFFCREIACLLSAETNIVCTARLDNDDAINSTFVEALHAHISGLPESTFGIRFWVTFPVGAQWDGKIFRLLVLPNNAFIGSVESASTYHHETATTPFGINHTYIGRHGKIETILPIFPMWLRNVHGTNVANSNIQILSEFANPKRELDRFGLGHLIQIG